MPNIRLLAIQSLLEIFYKEVTPKNSLENISSTLARRDRAFLMEVVYGVIRYRDTLDWILKQYLNKMSKLPVLTINNMRLALYQIYFMRVPDFAVVNESVEIEKQKGKPSVVNAVLRNILRKKDDHTLPVRFDDPVSDIAINTSHPRWLVRRWIKRFGEKEAALLARANNRIPLMTIRTNTLKVSREELLSILSDNNVTAEPTPFSPDGIVIKNIHSYRELSFIHGLFFVQDEASQCITYLLNPQPGERILDACAAPGGKATHIAQRMNDDGEIIAVEKNPLKIERIEENLKVLGITSVKTVNDDVTLLKERSSFDRILVDAPCSALGVVRRNPDVKYRHTMKGLLAYRIQQKDILYSVSNLLKKNGILVYSVCSTEPEEGEEVIHDFLKTKKDFRIIDTDFHFLKQFTQNGFLRTYPQSHHMDGFFGASMERR